MKRFAWLLILWAGVAVAEPIDLPTHVKEGASSFLSVTFKDQSFAVVVPNTVKWYISDEATGALLLSDEAVGTPASTMTFDFSPCACRILNTTKNTENRLVTILFTYGGSSQYIGTEYARFVCENLPALYVKEDCSVIKVSTPTPTSTPVRTATPTRTPT